MTNNNSASAGGIGFLGLLTILFIALKLCKVIDWSWSWVLSPILIPFAIAVTVDLVMLGIIIYKEKNR